MKLSYKHNTYSTHQPILIETIKRLSVGSNILELGTGEGSTELLNILSRDTHYVLSVDHDEEWINKYKEKFRYNSILSEHEFKKLSFDQILKDPDVINISWDLIFVDQGDWASREECILYFKDKAKYIILHDSDPYANPFGTAIGDQIKPLAPYEKPGISNFDKTFKYWMEVYPPLPWPAPTGPPTLLASNFFPVDKFEFDWETEEI